VPTQAAPARFALDEEVLSMDHRLFLQHDFALINPLQLDAGQWSGLPTEPLVPDTVESQAQLMPRLVLLRELAPDARSALLDQSEAWQAAYDLPMLPVLIQSGASAAAMTAHLKKQMLSRHPAGHWFWIRFHDPRVFRHLRWLLDPAQMARLMGPASQWTWFDPSTSNWCTDARPDADPTSASRLDSRQWDCVFRMEVVNRALKGLAHEHPSMTFDQWVYRQMDEAVRMAVEVEHLQELDDQLAYACHAQRFGSAFHALPAVRRCLDDARTGACSYVGGIADLDPQLFASLAPSDRVTGQSASATQAPSSPGEFR